MIIIQWTNPCTKTFPLSLSLSLSLTHTHTLSPLMHYTWLYPNCEIDNPLSSTFHGSLSLSLSLIGKHISATLIRLDQCLDFYPLFKKGRDAYLTNWKVYIWCLSFFLWVKNRHPYSQVPYSSNWLASPGVSNRNVYIYIYIWIEQFIFPNVFKS